MSELHHSENLIDLSIEDDVVKVRSQTNISNDRQSSIECTLPDCLIVATKEGRESLDNNPFDSAQKLASRSNDPFDLVEKEACVKARFSMLPTKEVKEGKLLSLSDDNIIDDVNWHMNEKTSNEESFRGPIMGTAADYSSSTIYHSVNVHNLDSESPPISMSTKSTPDSCSSALESDESSAKSTDGNSSKLRKALENRKRLLKLSLANSTFNSPLSCRTQQGDSGFSTAFSAAAHFSDYILATESPLKLVDDDPTEEPPNIEDAEKNFEADLKMLSIPMLRKLPSPVPEETSIVTNEQIETPSQTVKPSDLSALRDKLRANRIKACKGQDVMSLIDNLKSLLCENYIVDEEKKEQANCLLKKLSSALSTDKLEDNNDSNQQTTADNCEVSTQAPQTIVRQGTFDMELQPADIDKCDNTGGILPISGDASRITHSLQPRESLSPAKEIPEVMVKSSATYDGENVTERENLLLPLVESISPIPAPNCRSGESNVETTHPDVNDIIEQIGKLLEQHQIATQASHDQRSSSGTSAENNEQRQSAMPTFIVVMPTNSVQSISKQSVNNSICDDRFEDMSSNISMRRRSQSLSSHDKVKIIQLPIRSQAIPSTSEANQCLSNIECSSQINTNTLNIKTPVRPNLRRNSFSSGTPLTPLTSLNHAAGIANIRRVQNAQISSRYSLGPSKWQERENQQQAVVHPIPRTNLNTFKPDLRRRSKQQTVKTSVMTSSQPLKAVIPIKKVAPMLTATMATPEGPKSNSRLLSQRTSMETSMQLLTKAGKISNTSTPMPAARGGEQISQFPNACSTPALACTAAKPSGTVTKKNPRFSISTPTSKLHQPYTSTSTSGLKKHSLPELTKSKSPVHARISLAGTSTVKGRQTIKQLNVSKQTTSLLRKRSSTRSSVRGGTTSTNKENKKP